MKLHAIDTGFFKLDGGAMYGVVPKSIWNKLNPSDGNNLCSWAMRCLLIEQDNRLILIDTGLGNKQDNKFFGHYFLHGEQSLIGSLHEKGFSPSDVTDVILTHLHFDHCGGAIEWNAAKDGFRPVFNNATYWSSKSHWQCATQPNPREKASFLKENILPIEESGQLKFIEEALPNDFAGTEFLFSYGHTEAMVLPKLNYKGHEIIYMADLIPSVGHIPLPYVMAYDTQPLITMEEKKRVLTQAVENNSILFFEHDPVNECCTLKRTEKGIIVDQTFKLGDLE